MVTQMREIGGVRKEKGEEEEEGRRRKERSTCDRITCLVPKYTSMHILHYVSIQLRYTYSCTCTCIYMRAYVLTRGYNAVAHTEHYRNEHIQRYRQALSYNIMMCHFMLCYVM